MRQKTTLYALISLLLTAVIVCGGVWFNHRFPLLPENGSLAGMDLSHAVTLTGWTQTSPGQWRVQFTDAPADAEWVVCFPGRTRRVQPEALEPMERSEEFFRLPEGASEITVRAPSVPRAWLMPAGTAWRWLDLRSSLQLVTLAAFVSMGAGILALFCFKPQYELGYFLLYLGIMFGWGLSVYLHPLTTSTTHDVLQRCYFSFAVLVPIWLCSALTHGPRLTRKSRSFSAAAGLMVLFLALSTAQSIISFTSPSAGYWRRLWKLCRKRQEKPPLPCLRRLYRAARFHGEARHPLRTTASNRKRKRTAFFSGTHYARQRKTCLFKYRTLKSLPARRLRFLKPATAYPEILKIFRSALHWRNCTTSTSLPKTGRGLFWWTCMPPTNGLFMKNSKPLWTKKRWKPNRS